MAKPKITRQGDDASVFFVEHSELRGKFKLKRLTIGDKLALGRIQGDIMGPSPDDWFRDLAETFATCEVGYEIKPDAFDPRRVEDNDLINTLYEEVLNFQRPFRGGGEPSAGESKAEAGGESGPASAPVVGGEVPPAA